MILEVTDELMREALDRIARTPDGELLYRYLQKVLMGVAGPDIDIRMLPKFEGRRLFASELMALMGQGIAESGRASHASVTFVAAGKRDAVRSRGAGRRVTLDTYVDGYDAPHDAEPGSN